VYATSSFGVGGVIRQFVDDFVVEEILVDGSKAELKWSDKPKVLGSSAERKRYPLCVLVKRNWDTFLAIKALAEQLGINANDIHFAGIKDAKAVTAQYITLDGVSAEEVLKANVKDIEIHPIGYLRHKISAYYLLGNSFNITIRSINHSKSSIKKRMEKIIEESKAVGGIPNFFGHQRFGTVRPITHIVGKALVKGNFKKAIMLFLAKPSPYEHPESRKAREQLQKTQDFRYALKSFPKQLHYERLMLKHLAQKPQDFAGAFRRLPIKLRELFPQAYQAYLFNKFLSKRIAERLPLNKAEVGDYIVSVQRSGLPLLTMYKVVKAETLAEINEAMKAGRLQLALPLIGFRQKTSEGIQGEVEKQILEKEGITIENFKIKNMPEISPRGELRTALTPLKNFQLKEVCADAANPSKNMAKISFALHRGSYATVLLREIMKPRNLLKAGF
ncbi:MAG: tRNA pseudouridine(13) synthase TruD, partial [Candidatus Bathyarchaeia archaeon]|nr:tRNA pseudouridine(13) synthase TruD [Candidatus Bathyarchaeia archaeon]